MKVPRAIRIDVHRFVRAWQEKRFLKSAFELWIWRKGKRRIISSGVRSFLYFNVFLPFVHRFVIFFA